MRILIISLVYLILPNSHTSIAAPAAAGGEESWWRHGLLYQVYPRSFKDSNNDGIGDLPGITSKLGYLKDLGVTGVWLSPIYPSPMVDFGYDISNFTDVNPEFGTLQDFDQLISNANQLGLGIIMDFVPNHSSDEHEWFKRSVRREAGYEDFYVWRNKKGTNPDGTPIPPNNWVSLFYGPAWEWNEERGQFYLHQFAKAQPDLNYMNPAVIEAMDNVIKFWLHRGVRGFRIDAIPFMFEDPELRDEPVDPAGSADPNDYSHLQHIYTRDYQPTYDMVTKWRAIIDNQTSIDNISRCMMVEAYATLPLTMKYFGTAATPAAHFPFNFQLIPINHETSADDFKRLIHEWDDNLPADVGHCNWLTGNHDNHRIGSRVGEDLIDAMNIMILSLSGTAVTYYGEEIGMVDNLAISYEDGKDPQGCNNDPANWYQLSRDFERTPFQWDNTTNAGFNDGATTWLPVHENYKTVNVEAQQAAYRSHLNVYKSMTGLRQSRTLLNGRQTISTTGPVLAILRSLGSTEYTISVLNLGDEDLVVNLDEVTLVGEKTQLAVYTSSIHSSLEPGALIEAGSVSLSKRAAAVLIPIGTMGPKAQH